MLTIISLKDSIFARSNISPIILPGYVNYFFKYTYVYALLPIVIFVVLSSLKQINEYERGFGYTMGRLTGIVEPGWRLVWPILQSFRKVDIRTKAVDVPKQETVTKDNVSIKMNAVIYYKVRDAGKSINEAEDVFNAVSQLAQTTTRRIAGEVTLDELLQNRKRFPVTP